MTPSNFTETPSNLSVPASGPNVPVLLLAEWQEAFPGVVAGITTGGSGWRVRSGPLGRRLDGSCPPQMGEPPSGVGNGLRGARQTGTSGHRAASPGHASRPSPGAQCRRASHPHEGNVVDGQRGGLCSGLSDRPGRRGDRAAARGVAERCRWNPGGCGGGFARSPRSELRRPSPPPWAPASAVNATR